MYFLHHFVMTTIVVFIISHTAHSINCTESLTAAGYTGELNHDKEHNLNFKNLAGLYAPRYGEFVRNSEIVENDWKNQNFIKVFCEEDDKITYSSKECHDALKNNGFNGKLYHDDHKINDTGNNFRKNNKYGFSYGSSLLVIRKIVTIKAEGPDEDMTKQMRLKLKKLDMIKFFCDEKEEYLDEAENCTDSLTAAGYTGVFKHDNEHKPNFENLAGLYAPGYEEYMRQLVNTKNGEEERKTEEGENAPENDWKNQNFIPVFCEHLDKYTYSSKECHAELEKSGFIGIIYHDYNKIKDKKNIFGKTNKYGFSYGSSLFVIRSMFTIKAEGPDEDMTKQMHLDLKKLDMIEFVCDEKEEYRDEAEEGNFFDEKKAKIEEDDKEGKEKKQEKEKKESTPTSATAES